MEQNVNFLDFQCTSILVKGDSQSDGKQRKISKLQFRTFGDEIDIYRCDVSTRIETINPSQGGGGKTHGLRPNSSPAV